MLLQTWLNWCLMNLNKDNFLLILWFVIKILGKWNLLLMQSNFIQIYSKITKVLCFDFDRDQVRLPFTWSRGMQTFSCFSTVRRTLARRSRELGICSTPCGSLTSLWRGSRRMRSGPWWTLMSAQGYMTAGERSLRPSIKSRSLFPIFNPGWYQFMPFIWISVEFSILVHCISFVKELFIIQKTDMWLND